MSQVAYLARQIIESFDDIYVVSKFYTEDQVPTVFVKNGVYQNGNIILDVVNKSQASSFDFSSNVRETENANEVPFNQTISLSGAYNERVVIDTGYLFDIGLSVKGESSNRSDNMYLADGPWGVDFDENMVNVEDFNVYAHQNDETNDNEYVVERSVELEGEVSGTVNIFRSILGGDLTLDVSEYEGLSFEIKNNLPVEVIVVPHDLEDWTNRPKFTIEPSEEGMEYEFLFSDFAKENGEVFTPEKVRSVVFSIQGDYMTYAPMEITVDNLKFVKDFSPEEELEEEEVVEEVPEVEEEQAVDFEETLAEVYDDQLKLYPNPTSNMAVIKIGSAYIDYIEIQVVDLLGKTVINETMSNQDGSNEFVLDVSKLGVGIYKYQVISSNFHIYTGTLMINE